MVRQPASGTLQRALPGGRDGHGCPCQGPAKGSLFPVLLPAEEAGLQPPLGKEGASPHLGGCLPAFPRASLSADTPHPLGPFLFPPNWVLLLGGGGGAAGPWEAQEWCRRAGSQQFNMPPPWCELNARGFIILRALFYFQSLPRFPQYYSCVIFSHRL